MKRIKVEVEEVVTLRLVEIRWSWRRMGRVAVVEDDRGYRTTMRANDKLTYSYTFTGGQS